MGLFNRKPAPLSISESVAKELDVLRAVMAKSPPGHQLRQGDRCACPVCGTTSFVVSGNRNTSSSAHRCVNCDHAWVITARALKAYAAEDSTRTADLLAAATAAGTGAPLQVLLVEDDPADAAMVHAILAPVIPDAVQIVHVDNRGEAERTALLGFDVVLLDLNLPDSVGADTEAHFRSAVPGAKVCVCTGDGDLASSALGAGRPVLHKHQLVDLAGRHQHGTAELLAVLRAAAAA